MTKKQEIKNHILRMIRQGALAPGERIPSIRRMAQEFHVSMTPVMDAYCELEADRWLECRPRSGYFVSLQQEEALRCSRCLTLNDSEHYDLLDSFLSGYSSISANSGNNVRYPFGTTPVNSRTAFESELNPFLVRAAQSARLPDNGLIHHHDETALKRAVMKWMLSCRCANSVEDLSIVHSITSGLLLAVRACAAPGSAIAVEAPGHAGFYFIAEFLDCRVIPVPSRPDSGLDVDAFAALLARGLRPACLLLSSNFSNPTGALMSDVDKRRLTELCARKDIPIIEDDALGELFFGETRPLPLKSFDNDNVIYVSGFGKCLSPVLRLGYVSAGRHRDAFALQKHLTVSYTHPYLQQALADYLDSGAAARNVADYRRRLRRDVERYREKLLQVLPDGTSVESPAGGPYLWVTLPEALRADALCDAAIAAGISIAPGRLYNASAEQRGAFRFNCAAISPGKDSLSAVETLGRLAHSALKSRSCGLSQHVMK